MTTQTGLQSERDRILRESEQETSEGCEKEERAIRGGEGMMYRGVEATTNTVLEL
jgi:hypothetical protein